MAGKVSRDDGYKLVVVHLGLLMFLIRLQQAGLVAASQPISCLDDDGKPVDWYIVYKIPVLDSHKDERVKSGWAYAYITNNTASEPPLSRSRIQRMKNAKAFQAGWIMSDKLIGNKDSLVIKTLQPVYERKELSSVFYSDQTPGGKNSGHNRAHSKGALIIDEENDSGVWLTHTVPRFPQPRSQENIMLDNSRMFGQTFMCISFTLQESGETLIDHLWNLRPFVYDAQLSQELISRWPLIKDLRVDGLKGKRLSSKGKPFSKQEMRTKDGQSISLYSQSGDGGQDFYGFLNEELGSNLLVESWRNGVRPLQSNCPSSESQVNNIQEVRISNEARGSPKVQWSSTKDHSKWAITQSEDTGVICMSDINRMQSQFKRGGGSICMKCSACWETFKSSIMEVEPCPRPESKENLENLENSDSSSQTVVQLADS